MQKLLTLLLLTSGLVNGQLTPTPAAKTHVKLLGGQAFKHTTKLKKVIDLNFTMGYHHSDGKPLIEAALNRIAAREGFTVLHLKTGTNGDQENVIPPFTDVDLASGEVIFGNNISGFGKAVLGVQKQTWLQQAIEVKGKGFLGHHATGDNQDPNWVFYSTKLHPMNYQGHGDRPTAPVYKNPSQANHVCLQGILESKVVVRTVPTSVNAGVEVLSPNIKTRDMVNEWYWFRRNIMTDPLYANLTTTLLKYDPRNLDPLKVLGTEYHRLGGNLYTHLIKVGAGIASYIPAGHDNTELFEATGSFDQGTGDYDRYLTQMLWFLAGYTLEPCATATITCTGLPLVDSLNQIKGTYVPTAIGQTGILKSKVYVAPEKMAFSSPFEAKDYEAKVTDLSGHVLASKSGKGVIYYEFNQAQFRSGVYLLSVKVGKAQPVVQRYAFMPAGR